MTDDMIGISFAMRKTCESCAHITTRGFNLLAIYEQSFQYWSSLNSNHPDTHILTFIRKKKKYKYQFTIGFACQTKNAYNDVERSAFSMAIR